MKRLDPLSPSTHGIPWQNLLLASSLFWGVATGCGPKNDPATTNATTTNAMTGPASITDGVTDTGSVTLDVSTSTSSSVTSDPAPTTTDPTCPVFLCGDFMGPECDVFAQDCPDGEKCAAVMTDGFAYDSARCVPVGGIDVAGEPCSAENIADGLDSCAPTTPAPPVRRGNEATARQWRADGRFIPILL